MSTQRRVYSTHSAILGYAFIVIRVCSPDKKFQNPVFMSLLLAEQVGLYNKGSFKCYINTTGWEGKWGTFGSGNFIVTNVYRYNVYRYKGVEGGSTFHSKKVM